MNKLNFFSTSVIVFFCFLCLLLTYSCNDPVGDDNTPPNASFSIDPLIGNTETIFNFDATECVDYEDDLDLLEIHWDWENDGDWDTDFSTNKKALHQYTEAGEYTIRMEVKDTQSATNSTTKTVTVYFGNSPPVALFTIDPLVGFIDTTFTFDASDSHDIEDPKDSLLIRWDWNGDAVWDTQFSYQKMAYHKYDIAGNYNVKIEVKDTKGLSGMTSNSLEVTFSNEPPNHPDNPFPGHTAINQSTKPVLTWEGSDPDGDPLTYDIYFGTQDNPPLVKQSIEETSYDPGFLEYDTQYYWKIVVKDNHDQATIGSVWSFHTHQVENEMGSFTDERDGKVYKTVTIGGIVWMAENLNIGNMIHSSTGGGLGDGTSTDNGILEKYCYGNDPNNCEIYGGLYQWNEAMVYTTDSINKGICPAQWHLPTFSEWEELTANYIEEIAGRELRFGSISGFQAKYAGNLYFSLREYQSLEHLSHFWSSTEFPRDDQDYNTHSWVKSLYDSTSDMHKDIFAKTYGLSIRCVRDF